MVILIVIALIVLGYFGFNVKEIIEGKNVQGNLQYVWNLAATVWNRFLIGPATFVWDKLVLDLFWENLKTILRLGQTTRQSL